MERLAELTAKLHFVRPLLDERSGASWRPAKRGLWATGESVWCAVHADCRARRLAKGFVKSKGVPSGWKDASDARCAACPSLWHLRCGAPHRVRQCRDRSRHGRVCGGLCPRMVAPGRPTTPSGGHPNPDYSRRRGSNGWRLRLWKPELQTFTDEVGLPLSVCHFPPGTSKWDKIGHRPFPFISSNWRREPLRDYETVVHLIVKTTTAKGLKVTCRLDRSRYPTGRKVSNAEMKGINLQPDTFHGEWNDVIKPHQPRPTRRPRIG